MLKRPRRLPGVNEEGKDSLEMRCEHDWQKREPGREETDADVFNVGVVEWTCDKCGKYETRIGSDSTALSQLDPESRSKLIKNRTRNLTSEKERNGGT
jgi:hypothetical protein